MRGRWRVRARRCVCGRLRRGTWWVAVVFHRCGSLVNEMMLFVVQFVGSDERFSSDEVCVDLCRLLVLYLLRSV